MFFVLPFAGFPTVVCITYCIFPRFLYCFLQVSSLLYVLPIAGFLSDDELCCSSGSESREGSAGKSGRQDSILPPRPPDNGTPRSRRKPAPIRSISTGSHECSQALSLDIPSKLQCCNECSQRMSLNILSMLIFFIYLFLFFK